MVDNASTDGSAERIEREFAAVKMVRAGANLGFARGNNVGLQHAEGSEWVVLLNPDACAERDWLEKLVGAAEAHPDCASIGSRLLRADDPLTLDGTGDVYHMSGLHWREAYGKPLDALALAGKEIFSPCAAPPCIAFPLYGPWAASTRTISAIRKMWTLGSACA